MADPTPTTGFPAGPDVTGPLPASPAADGGQAVTPPPTAGAVPGYELLEPLGEGGMGVVWKARQVRLNRPVALKMALGGGRVGSKELIRFLAEAEAVAAVRHPHVVQVYEYGEHDGRPFLAMEYLSGGSLAERLETGGRLAPRAAAELVRTLAEAVQAAHDRGIVHRDLKPANVLFDEAGRPKVADFGLAKRDAGGGLTATRAVLGTPAYMAPEQARGDTKFVGPEADVYSLGVILYECLTGTRPFAAADHLALLRLVAEAEPERPGRRAAGVPRDVELICLKFLAKDPLRRYRSAEALAGDLDRWLHGLPILARDSTPWERAVRWVRRRPMAAALVVVSVAAAAALLVMGLIYQARLYDERQEVARERGEARRATAAARQANAEAELLLAQAEGLRLSGQSAVALPTNPGLALLLAVAGADKARPRTAAHNNALVAALQTCRERRTFVTRDRPAESAVLSGDGRLVLATYANQTASVWDVASGREVKLATPPGLGIGVASLSPDGRLALLTFYGYVVVRDASKKDWVYTDRTARLYDTATGKELARLKGHANKCTGARFSPDGRRVVTASWDQSARVWDAATGKLLLVLAGHRDALAHAAFSADGRFVLTVSGLHHDTDLFPDFPPADVDPPGAAGTVQRSGHIKPTSDGTVEEVARIWDSTTGKQVAVLPRSAWADRGLQALIPAAAVLSADARSVCIPAGDGTWAVWDVTTGNVLAFPPGAPTASRHLMRVFEGRERMVHAAAFHRDGRRLYTLDKRTLRAWDHRTGKELRRIEVARDEGGVTSACLSADAERCALTSADRTAGVWESETGREIGELKGHDDPIRQAAFGADDRQVVTASEDGTVRVWDTSADVYGTVLRGHQGTVNDAVYSPDGRTVLTASADKTARLWEAASGRTRLVLRPDVDAALPAIREHALGPVRTAKFSPDGRRILTLSDDDFVVLVKSSKTGETLTPLRQVTFTPLRVWDARTGKQVFALRGLDSEIARADFSPDGRWVLASPGAQLNRWWLDAVSGMEWERRFGLPPPDKSARLWDLETGRLVTVPPWGDSNPARYAVFSPDGKRVLAGDWEASVYDGATRKELAHLDRARLGSEPLFSPDGQKLLTVEGPFNDVLPTWDARTGRKLATLQGHTSPVTATAYSPDSRRVVTGCRDGTVRVWDAATGTLRALLRGHWRAVNTAAFSPDGRWVVTASDDRTARVWDVEGGWEYVTLAGHQDAVRTAAFSPDGRHVLTASADGTARIWPADPLPLARRRLPRALSAEERDQSAAGTVGRR